MAAPHRTVAALAVLAGLLGACLDEPAGDPAALPLASPGVVPPCAVPTAPMLDRIHRGATLVFTAPAADEIQVGAAADPDAVDPERWLDADRWSVERSARLHLFARATAGGCDATFDHTYLASAGYAPAAGQPGTAAVARDDPRIVGWATGWVEPVAWGSAVSASWRDPARALGPAEGAPSAVVSLGNGGSLTLSFDPAIGDGPGPDLAVYENALDDTFLELAFVEVSSDGVHFERFDAAYLGVEPLGGYGGHDPELIAGLAGKYRRGFGVPFDLALLRYRDAARDGRLDLGRVTHVRIVDVIGDGSATDSFGQPIYDPHPTSGSGGFDLDGVAVLNAGR